MPCKDKNNKRMKKFEEPELGFDFKKLREEENLTIGEFKRRIGYKK